MEYVYASLLLHAAKKEINEENLKKILESAGVTPDDAKLKALVASLDGVNIDEAISKTVATSAAPVGAKEEKKEEQDEQPEKRAEEAAEGLAGLFG